MRYKSLVFCEIFRLLHSVPLGWQHWNNVQNENQNALAVLFVLCDGAKILHSMSWQDLVVQFELTQLTLDAWQEVSNVVNVLVVVWQDLLCCDRASANVQTDGSSAGGDCSHAQRSRGAHRQRWPRRHGCLSGHHYSGNFLDLQFQLEVYGSAYLRSVGHNLLVPIVPVRHNKK